ncbi:hypothetical protein Q8A67_015917 [Cirrhinus molitorella]|uniref:Uncharacterized protein n=1 Tax=Cirrhinus molitorella TaxID=172907 RepID=A0AA88TJA0_9TELE|nr:hypothetical protein Q8A67_015917 [Cirrhinus molitorella]
MMLNHLPRPLLSTSPRCAENQPRASLSPSRCVPFRRVNVQAAGSIDTALPSQQPLFWRRPAPIGVCSALASPIFLSQINLGPFSALFLSGCACSWGRQACCSYRTCHNRNKISRSKRQVCRFALPKEASSDPQPNSRFIRFNQRTPGEETPAPIAALRASGFEFSAVLVSFLPFICYKLCGETGPESADERKERCRPDGMMGRRNKARAVWCSHLFRSQHKGSMPAIVCAHVCERKVEVKSRIRGGRNIWKMDCEAEQFTSRQSQLHTSVDWSSTAA